MTLHTGENPFKCSHCNKAFRTKKGMEEHTKTHTDDLYKSNKCKICGTGFKNYYNYANHMVEIHKINLFGQNSNDDKLTRDEDTDIIRDETDIIEEDCETIDDSHNIMSDDYVLEEDIYENTEIIDNVEVLENNV